MGLTDNWRIAKILTDQKNSFNNYINWFWLINYASIISDVMKSLSEGSLHESVRHKLNAKGEHTSYPVLPPEGVYWFSYDVIRCSVYLLSNRTQ